MIRTFLALEVDPGTRDRLMEDVSELRARFPGIKWAGKDNLHLTLKFLGDVAESDLNAVFAAADRAAGEHRRFAVEVTNLGVFPHWRAPRVVWAGCGEGGAEIVRLHRSIENELARLGYQPEKRRYSPHLTLGRVKLPADAHGLHAAALPLLDNDYGFIDIDAVTVFMSELKRAGPVYTPMHHAALM